MGASTLSGIGIFAITTLLVTFGVAAISKLWSGAAFRGFYASLSQFGLRNRRAQIVAACAAICAELISIVLLAAPGLRPVSRIGPGVVLLVAFSFAVALAGARRTSFACHCFGSSSNTNVRLHLTINGVLVAIGILGMLFADRPSPLTIGDEVLAGGLGTIAGLTSVAITPILEVLAPGLVFPPRALPQMRIVE